MAALGDPQVREFLSYGTRTGKLAYLAPSGRPLVAPVWFVVEDGGTLLDIVDELFKDGAPGTADFDEIRIYAGDCPTAPTGAPHACP